jgi:hypothetical protein
MVLEIMVVVLRWVMISRDNLTCEALFPARGNIGSRPLATASGWAAPWNQGWGVFIIAPQPGTAMFFFFSNRLGCLGSLVVSAAATVVLLFWLGILRL